MHHNAHIGLVDTHTEGICSNNHSCLTLFPFVLLVVLVLIVEPGMVIVGSDVIKGEFVGNHLRLFAAANIHDSRPRHTAKNMHKLCYLVVALTHNVGDIVALKALGEHVRGMKLQLFHNIGHHIGCSSGCECQNRNCREYAANGGNLEIGGAEIIAPLRYTVCLINYNERHIHKPQLVDKSIR